MLLKHIYMIRPLPVVYTQPSVLNGNLTPEVVSLEFPQLKPALVVFGGVGMSVRSGVKSTGAQPSPLRLNQGETADSLKQW